ncbi:hypothetical protein M378DRAFT_6361 [Amanita muscaria Koide BX008]|uniref:Uncharacterized protein n=1 Tax=Amanita muscaria (strain Koide BX008) TaxID=946122 RepID=A0A0C2TW60_AMAMK|nr:hypothetical protein M378DRAFT_6361 [Amanita muscaria Koide BX008]
MALRAASTLALVHKSGVSSGTQPHPSIVEPKFRRAAADSSSRTSTPITPPSMETDLLRALQLIQELSDQIAQNHKMASSLYAQTVVVKKDQASVVTSGFSLRRFNVDISKETFESELERRNARLNLENQALLHENKQLDSLMKEYETTLETVMSKFRNHSYTGQRHEHTLTRHYEILIHTRETQAQSPDMSYNVQTVMSLHRIAFLLGCLLRCANGEELEQPYLEPEHFRPEQPYIDLTELEALVDKIGDDWWIQREVEIARLEKENEELRRMLKIDAQTMQESGVTLDVNRYDYGRTIARRPMQQQQQQQQPSSTPPNGDPKLPWVENDGQPQGPGPGGQRMTELQPGMRMGSQVRRSGIIGGGGQQRGLLVSGGMASTGGNGAGNGRTFSLGIGPPPSTGGGGGQQAIWSNPPAVSPAPPLVVERVVERPWLSGLDLSR